MELFHGSPEDFQEFILREDLCKHDIQTVLTEGMGVYMTERRNVAESYGKYLYTVEIDENNLLDMTHRENVFFYISTLSKALLEIGCNFVRYIGNSKLYDLVNGVLEGQISNTDIAREVALLLDSCEKFYTDGHDYELIISILRREQKKLLRDSVIKFNDGNLGEVYIAKNPKLVKILKQERWSKEV